jgi:hypothetical protein
MVVGVDVEIGEILYLLGRMEISRFYGKTMSTSSLKVWLDINWTWIFGVSP